MSEETKKQLERILPWSFLGLLATLIVGMVATYFAVIEKAPDVVFEVVSQSNVLDVHKPMKDLSISFRGEDIQEKKENLRILTINVQNQGQLNIRQNDFDQVKPWGIRIANAQIVEEPKIIDSNSDYIRENLKPKIVTNNLVEFSKIIFEKGKYFTLEIQILHPVAEDPEIFPVGKIAGVEKQQLIRYSASKVGLSFWRQVFYGSSLVHVVRVIIYIIGAILLLIAIIAAIIWISEKRDKHKIKIKRNKKEGYLSPLLHTKDKKDQRLILSLLDSYMGNVDNLVQLQSIIENSDSLTEIGNTIQKLKVLRPPHYSTFLFPKHIFPKEIIKIEDDGTFIVEPDAKRLLPELTSFLRNNPVPRDLFPELGMSVQPEAQPDEK